MGLFGVGARWVKRAKQSNDLPVKVERARQLTCFPLIKHYDGARRFDVAAKLVDAELNMGRSSTRDIEGALSKLQREFDLARPHLQRESATHADLVATTMVVHLVSERCEGLRADFTSVPKQVAQSQSDNFQYEVRLANAEIAEITSRSYWVAGALVTACVLGALAIWSGEESQGPVELGGEASQTVAPENGEAKTSSLPGNITTNP